MRGDGAGEDVDGDCPLPMRGALVMTMVMISPSRRESFPGKIALPEPKIGSAKVPPRGGGVSSEEMAYDFSSSKDSI